MKSLKMKKANKKTEEFVDYLEFKPFNINSFENKDVS